MHYLVLFSDLSGNLASNLAKYRPHFVELLVDFGLVFEINFGQGKEADPGQNDKGKSVEPSTDVRDKPKHDDKLGRLDQVLDEQKRSKPADEVQRI